MESNVKELIDAVNALLHTIHNKDPRLTPEIARVLEAMGKVTESVCYTDQDKLC
jgi:hypothetical protein